jgi:ATP-dependent exoDNAse (exonuclease V) beta subunit
LSVNIPTSRISELSVNIKIISAGAGSGKTHRLTGEMFTLMKEGKVHPSGIIATTFTKKAAAELQERVRLKLLQEGENDAATELGEALIGTVHSIGTRLLQRFAFEAGVSPLVEIIADGDEQRIFNESLAQVLTQERTERMNLLADRLGLTKKSYGGAFDWRRDIMEITEVARANNFSMEVLQHSKQLSWQSFERLLPPAANTDATVWNNRLLSAIDQTIAALEENSTDTTKTTMDGIENLRSVANQLKFRGELYWHEWSKLAKLTVGAKSRDLTEDLVNLARSHDQHPQFREDIKGYMDLAFDIASDALEEYEQYKKKRGLIDYTDMEAGVSRLLRRDDVKEALRGSIGLLLVDEFQDTSPIQLDIFLKLSEIADQAIWVGDPKQSIYGFRGAEPALMQAVIEATGGVKDADILRQSWRSRPDLVYASNAIFKRAFTALPEAQIVLEPAFTADKELQEVGRGLIHWHFKAEPDNRKVPGAPWSDNCIADQIRIFLERAPHIYQGKDRKESRPVRPGDIAVLCRNNAGCLSMAEALHRSGLKASISRAGLLHTKESRLALACLRYLLTASDSLSVAEILLLTGTMDLSEMVNDRLEYLHRREQEEHYSRWAKENPFLEQLDALRSHTTDLSASEILELVITELDLRRVVARLGNIHQRLDNLDRLRRYALDYESACKRLHSAATLGGFLLWTNSLSASGGDLQGSGEGDDAVKVLTYHKSKGLEFPVTVCHNLDQNLKEKIWGINLVSESEKPDLNDILGRRWLRFWLNPYADQLGRTNLEEAILQTEEWEIARIQALEEETRLLYVGITRPRDYLIFPTTVKSTKWLNRVFNNGNEDTPTLDPDTTETPFYNNEKSLHCETEVIYKPRDWGEITAEETTAEFPAERKGRHNGLIQKQISVTSEAPADMVPDWGEPVSWGGWIEFNGDYTPALTQILRSLLCTVGTLSEEQKHALAEHQVGIKKSGEQVSVNRLVRQWNDFSTFIAHRYPAAVITAASPVEAIFGQRILKWEADLRIDSGPGTAIFVFAEFAEGMKKWQSIAREHENALMWVKKVWKDRNLIQPDTWLVFPCDGYAVELR